MLGVASDEKQIHIRLNPEQRKRIKRLAKARGISVTEYIAEMIDAQYDSVDKNRLAQLEALQDEVVAPRPLPKSAAKR